MALSIRNSRVEKLVRRLSRKRGETMTETIEKALLEMDAGLSASGGELYKKLSAIAETCAGLPDLALYTEDEILGYGESGA